MAAQPGLDRGLALFEQGRLAFTRGRPLESSRLLKRGLAVLARTPPNPSAVRLHARTLISLALAEFELRGVEVAMLRLDEAQDLIDAYGLQPLSAALHNQRGVMLLRLGRGDDAMRQFEVGVAVPGAEAAEDRCKILGNRASVHMRRGAVAAARSDLERCAREAAAAGLSLIEVRTRHDLGYVEFLAGNLPGALTLMDSAFAMDPTVSPGVSLLDKASVLVEAGLLQSAEAALQDAVTIFAEQRMTLDVATARLEQARCALALGSTASARRLAADARGRFQRRKNDAGRRAAELIVLQSDLAGGRVSVRLADAALELRGQLLRGGLRLPARIAGLVAVEAMLGRGRTGEAVAVLADLGPPARDDPITGRMHSHHVRAGVDAARGDHAGAARRVRRALGELAEYQSTFGSIDLRTASAVHGRRLVELDIGLALRTKRVARVFDAVERGRAVSSRLPVVHPPADTVAADLLAELRQTIEALRSVEQDRDASKPLLARRRELERRIVARTWGRAGAGGAVAPVDLERVASSPERAGRMLVTYFQSEADLWALSIGDGTRLHDLGPAAPVVESIRRARADLDVLARARLPAGSGGRCARRCNARWPSST